MRVKLALEILLVVGVLGLGFSGYLSYRELLGASEANACAPVGAPGTMLGYPPCLYGFVMYLGVVVIAALGLVGVRRASSGPRVHVS